MASIQLRGGVWQASIKVFDSRAGSWKWVNKSTRTADHGEAERICSEMQELALQAASPLSDAQVREASVETVNSILRISGRPCLPVVPTLRGYCESYVDGLDAVLSTVRAYESRLKSLCASLGDSTPLDRIDAPAITRWHRETAAKRTPAAANAALSTARAMFAQAVREGVIARNPAATVRAASTDSLKRDPFTREQVRAILDHCEATGNRSAAWLTACGLCLGARIRDCANLRVGDFQPAGEGLVVTFRPAKTGKHVTLPVLPPLLGIAREAIEERDPDEFCRPELAAIRDSSELSAVFTDVIEALGIEGAKLEDHGAGKRWRRLSHHSLRLTLNTWLQAGGSDRDARKEILGHASDRAHDHYTRPQIASMTAHMKKALASG